MSLIHCSGAPWLQSSTSSASGQRVLRSRDLRSSSTASPTEMEKGLISALMTAPCFTQPGLRPRVSLVEIIGADEADIKGCTGGTDFLTDFGAVTGPR